MKKSLKIVARDHERERERQGKDKCDEKRHGNLEPTK